MLHFAYPWLFFNNQCLLLNPFTFCIKPPTPLPSGNQQNVLCIQKLGVSQKLLWTPGLPLLLWDMGNKMRWQLRIGTVPSPTCKLLHLRHPGDEQWLGALEDNHLGVDVAASPGAGQQLTPAKPLQGRWVLISGSKKWKAYHVGICSSPH